MESFKYMCNYKPTHLSFCDNSCIPWNSGPGIALLCQLLRSDFVTQDGGVMEIVVQNHAPSLVLSITVFGSNRVHSVG